MARDQLRDDPFVWAFVKNHINEAPRIHKRGRHRRRTIQVSVALAAAVLISLFVPSAFSAGSAPIGGLEILSDGSGVIEVYGGGSPEEIADQLAAALDDTRFSGVWIDTQVGRPSVEGRIVHDGDGMHLIDQDPNFDNTATRIRLDEDATGPIFVMRPREPDELHRRGFELGCALAGMTWGEAERTALELGYELQAIDDLSVEELDASYIREVYTFGADAPARVVPTEAEALLTVQRCIDDGRTVGVGDNPTPAP